MTALVVRCRKEHRSLSLYCRPDLCLRYPEAWSSSFLSISVFNVYSPPPPAFLLLFVCDPLHLTGGPTTFNWELPSGAWVGVIYLTKGSVPVATSVWNVSPITLSYLWLLRVGDILWDPPSSKVECLQVSLVQMALLEGCLMRPSPISGGVLRDQPCAGGTGAVNIVTGATATSYPGDIS